MVTSLVCDIVYQAVEVTVDEMVSPENTRMQQQVEKSGGKERDISEYERIRNQRIAEREAEFKRLFPNFGNEVRGLRVAKKPRKKKARCPSGLPSRRSSRGGVGRVEGCLTSQLSDGVEVVEDIIEREVDYIDDGCAASEEDDNHEMVPSDPDFEARAGGVEGAHEHVQMDGDGVDNNGKFGCLPCGLAFRDTGNLRRHVRLVHEARSVPVRCPRTWCEEEFSILIEMRHHSKTCFLFCPYAGCSKKFRKQNLFDAHQRSHQVMARRMAD